MTLIVQIYALFTFHFFFLSFFFYVVHSSIWIYTIGTIFYLPVSTKPLPGPTAINRTPLSQVYVYHAEGEGAVLREIFEAMQFFGRTTSGDETFFYGLHTS